jgi:hypothetical protein
MKSTGSTANESDDVPLREYILRPVARTGVFLVLAGPVVWWLLSNIVALAKDGLLTGYGAICLTLFVVGAAHQVAAVSIPVRDENRQSTHQDLAHRAITSLATAVVALPGVLSFKWALNSILSAPKSGSLILPIVALLFSALWMVTCLEAMAGQL